MPFSVLLITIMPPAPSSHFHMSAPSLSVSLSPHGPFHCDKTLLQQLEHVDPVLLASNMRQKRFHTCPTCKLKMRIFFKVHPSFCSKLRILEIWFKYGFNLHLVKSIYCECKLLLEKCWFLGSQRNKIICL